MSLLEKISAEVKKEKKTKESKQSAGQGGKVFIHSNCHLLKSHPSSGKQWTDVNASTDQFTPEAWSEAAIFMSTISFPSRIPVGDSNSWGFLLRGSHLNGSVFDFLFAMQDVKSP
ncbi:hypothetical protein CDAR_82041 [Caerostris darwini]|uniref:Uncharacterized protein n=1 Tax=Caerostris darwini TaxID=1538125 RepID=A0AAV4UVT2_9ARAC|nr:hypothetical protein CDAR_82041 [Caerostris darwini]